MSFFRLNIWSILWYIATIFQIWNQEYIWQNLWFLRFFVWTNFKFRGFFSSFVAWWIFLKILKLSKNNYFCYFTMKKNYFKILLAKIINSALACCLSIFGKFRNIFAYLSSPQHSQQKRFNDILSKVKKLIWRIFMAKITTKHGCQDFNSYQYCLHL